VEEVAEGLMEVEVVVVSQEVAAVEGQEGVAALAGVVEHREEEAALVADEVRLEAVEVFLEEAAAVVSAEVVVVVVVAAAAFRGEEEDTEYWFSPVFGVRMAWSPKYGTG
jgi:hypothetical protein